MTRRALVTGATGFVGSHLVEVLLERGWEVRCTVRRTSNLRWLEGKSVERVECDLRGGEDLDRACLGIDCVYHVAGVLSAPSLSSYRAGNWLASKRLVEAAVRAGVPRFLHVSTLAAAGPSRDGRPVDETATPAPISQYGRTKWEGEREVRRHGERIGVTVIRPPVVYGPRDEGLLELYRALSFGVRFSIGGRKEFSIVHVRDLVEGMEAAASSEAARGEVYYLCNEEPRTFDGTVSLILASMGRKTRLRVHVPDAFAVALGSLAGSLPLRGNLFTRDKALEMVQKAWICTPAKARRELGFRARVPMEEGMRETLRWYGAQGLLP